MNHRLQREQHASPAGGIVLYLDFDGVLHADAAYRGPRRSVRMQYGQLFEWAPCLEHALAPYPDLRIVLSTSWVRVLGYERALGALMPALRHRVIGATYHSRIHGPTRELRDSWAQIPRGVQIAQDVARRRPAAWLAVDNAVDEFTPAQTEWLVPCCSKRGLSDPHAQERLDLLLGRRYGAQRR